LADGSQVVLDSLGNGMIAKQNGVKVLLQNGGVAYDPTGAAAGEVTYNTLTTPKGRQFRVVLPDGTRAWLNAASSIRYPTVFAGKERKIYVTGEAYFEVAKNTKLPFKVNINGRAEIEVLGTHFNVNAYENEASINTTLLEGRIRVRAGQSDLQKTQPGMEAVLKPGQQAQIMNVPVGRKIQPGSGGIEVIDDADPENVVSWKNGLFDFEGLHLAEVMRQLERWYDIKVQYGGLSSDRIFRGQMHRDVPLSEALEMLKMMGVKYEWKDGTLTIL
jgi:ferric-dicitrate binding protein FerR (iron transport regulator)